MDFKLPDPNFRRWLILGMVASGLLLAGWIGLSWASMPRLLQVSPAPGSPDVSPNKVLRLELTRLVLLEDARRHLLIQPEQPGTLAQDGTTLIFTPSRPWPAGTTITVTLSAGLRAADGWRFLLPLPFGGQTWSFHTRQRLLAYLWPASSSSTADIYVLDVETGETRQWTQQAGVLDFSFSEDGSQVYFSARNLRGGSDLWRLRLHFEPQTAPDTAPEKLLDCPDALCRQPAVSPDGEWLAYEHVPLRSAGQQALAQIILLPLGSQANGQPRQIGNDEHSLSQPAWARNGWLAYYDSDAQEYQAYNPDNGQILRMPNQTGESSAWQPDGTAFVAPEILYETLASLQTTASSHLMRYDLTHPAADRVAPLRDLTQDNTIEDTAPVFSPEGLWIAFARKYLDVARWTPGRQLWVMRADGSQAHALTQNPDFTHYDFTWSPDEQQIAYLRFNQSALNQPPELWVVNLDTLNPLQLVVDAYAPEWMP